MEKLEYIPGDLVYIHGSLRIVSNCDGYYATYYDENERLQEVNVNVIEGIPITPEILEKNGWKSINGKYALKIKNANYVVLEFTEYGIYTYINENTMLFTIKYIHELQHLLYALHIDSNLKIRVSSSVFQFLVSKTM